MSMTPADLTNLERLLVGPVALIKSSGADRAGTDDSYWLIRDEASGAAVAIMPCRSCSDDTLERLRIVVRILNAAPDLIKCARALQEIANHNHSACAEMDSLTERDCLRMIVESAKEALSAGQTGGKDAQ